jgi:hypothetical protein
LPTADCRLEIGTSAEICASREIDAAFAKATSAGGNYALLKLEIRL